MHGGVFQMKVPVHNAWWSLSNGSPCTQCMAESFKCIPCTQCMVESFNLKDSCTQCIVYRDFQFERLLYTMHCVQETFNFKDSCTQCMVESFKLNSLYTMHGGVFQFERLLYHEFMVQESFNLKDSLYTMHSVQENLNLKDSCTQCIVYRRLSI